MVPRAIPALAHSAPLALAAAAAATLVLVPFAAYWAFPAAAPQASRARTQAVVATSRVAAFALGASAVGLLTLELRREPASSQTLIWQMGYVGANPRSSLYQT